MSKLKKIMGTGAVITVLFAAPIGSSVLIVLIF
jgi:hypothetical protein